MSERASRPRDGHPRPRRLLLVRHGATDANEHGRFQGWSEAGLSERGVQELERTARQLAARATPAHVASSDLPRALETARLLFPGAAVLVDRRLRELSFGAFEGRTHQDLLASDTTGYRAWLEDPDRAPPPGGETLSGMRARVLAWWSDRGGVPGTLVVVAHGGPLGILLEHLLTEGDPSAGSVPRPGGYVELIADAPHSWRVAGVHLLPTPDVAP